MISDNRMGHVLLICPQTFSYHDSISKTLKSMGYSITWWNDRAKNTTFYKCALRMFPLLTVSWSEKFFYKKLNQIDRSSITHVLVIKGEGISRRCAQRLREAFPSASMGLYLWDGIENAKGALEISSIFDSVATFDPKDAEELGWFYRPLFGCNISDKKEVLKERFDWCFIGTIHSDRYRVIHRLSRSCDKRLRTFIFGYFQSPFIFYFRHLIDWSLWFAPAGTLSTKPMNFPEVLEVIRSSKAVVDIEHPRQRGLTMRTIETLLAEKKLVTTNKNIVMSNLYDPSRTYVISRKTPEIPIDFLNQPYRALPLELKDYYSCEGWAKELLQLQDNSKK